MKITNLEWRAGHMAALSCPSDTYYVKLANKLYDYIRFDKIDARFSDCDFREIALSITYYFEDVISEIGFWATFVDTHKELYNKYLPFFEIDEAEYVLDEVNLEDVRFLLWMGVQQRNPNSILNPENSRLTILATELYYVLDAEFEKAPINQKLVDVMFHDQWFTNFYPLKEWCGQIYSSTYLLQNEVEHEHLHEVRNELETMFGTDLEMVGYTSESVLSLTSKVGPLALTVPQWMSRLLKLKGMDDWAKVVDSVECMPFSGYLLKTVDEKQITVESLAGDNYAIARNSFRALSNDVLTTDFLTVSLARCGDGYWQACGGSSWSKNEELFRTAQKERQLKKERDQKLYDKLMNNNNHYPLLYFANYQEMKQWMATHIGIADEYVDIEGAKEQRDIVMFLENNGKFAILPDYATSIKDRRNPYYEKKEAKTSALSLVFIADMTSSRMIHYLVDHNMLPDACLNSGYGPARGRQLVQENMDFMLRFFRQYQY